METLETISELKRQSIPVGAFKRRLQHDKRPRRTHTSTLMSRQNLSSHHINTDLTFPHSRQLKSSAGNYCAKSQSLRSCCGASSGALHLASRPTSLSVLTRYVVSRYVLPLRLPSPQSKNLSLIEWYQLRARICCNMLLSLK